MRLKLASFGLAGLFLLVASPCVASLLTEAVKGGVGNRALSMGGAFTAVAEDGPALFYNPAGLGVPGGSYRYESMDMNKTETNGYFSHIFYSSPLAIGFVRKEDKNGNAVEVTGYGFGRQGRNGIDWGINYKSVAEKYTTHQSSGWSSDLGILAHVTPFLNAGFTAHDFMKQNVQVPTTFALGASLFTPAREIVVAGDVIQDNGLTTGFGVDYQLADGLALRGGLHGKQWSFGGLIGMPAWEINFGVSTLEQLTNPVIYRVGFRLGTGPDLAQGHKRYSLFKPTAYAGFQLDGSLIEGRSEISVLGGQKIGSNDLIRMIHQASDDISCKGFIIRIGNLTNSLASIGLVQDIRSELSKARQKGKKVYVYLENWATLPEYYLASVADEIFMPDLGTISHLGIELEVLKTKTFLNNFGINTTVIASGKHKDSLQPNSDTLTPASKIVLEEFVNNLYRQALFDIKESRKLQWEKVSDIFDGRVISAQKAKELGLVDQLGYWDSLKSFAKTFEKNEADPMIANLGEFAEGPEAPFLIPFFNKIAVLEVDGMIQLGQHRQNILFGGKGTGADEFDAVTEAIKKDPTIRGVIVRINSPGGSMIAADRIYESIEKLKKAGKMVYASFGNMAASGGYYVALNSHKIFANPGTLTGAVGVISVFQDQESFHRILGVDYDVIKTGKYMDMMSPNRSLSDDEKKMLKAFQDEHYAVFAKKVMDNRHMTKDEVNDVAQGQIFTGEQALKLKMVDELGNFSDVVDRLAQDAHIEDPQLVFYRPREASLLSVISGVLERLF